MSARASATAKPTSTTSSEDKLDVTSLKKEHTETIAVIRKKTNFPTPAESSRTIRPVYNCTPRPTLPKAPEKIVGPTQPSSTTIDASDSIVVSSQEVVGKRRPDRQAGPLFLPIAPQFAKVVYDASDILVSAFGEGDHGRALPEKNGGSVLGHGPRLSEC